MAEVVAAEESSPVELETSRLVLTLLAPSAAKRQVAYYSRNRSHLARWEPARPPGFYTVEFWRWRLEQNRNEFLEDRAMRLQLVARDATDGPVLGQLSFTEFVRGAYQGCNVGYSVDQEHQGQGLMREALEVSLAYMFDRLGMHRITAGYMPTNERSGKLLRRLGFHVEGYARDYLFIDGAWRDHVIASRVDPEGRRPGSHRRR